MRESGRDAPGPSPGRLRIMGRSLLRVVGFWWLATGVIVALERNELTRAAGLFVSTLLAVLGARLLVQTRDDRTRTGAQLAFVGAAFLWVWVSATLYGAWIVGLPTAPLGAQGTLALAVRAIRATAYNELLAIAVLAFAVVVHGRNPVGWWTVLAFWATDQLARLNIFFGVANPGTHFLPDRLSFLAAFFGPDHTSVLLPVSVVLLVALAAWLLRRAAVAADPFTAESMSLVGVLVALAALEHALLATSWQLPLWDLFLRARGG